MAADAERLPVIRIPKQNMVTTMRDDVVYVGGWLSAFAALGTVLEEDDPHPVPSRAVATLSKVRAQLIGFGLPLLPAWTYSAIGNETTAVTYARGAGHELPSLRD